MDVQTDKVDENIDESEEIGKKRLRRIRKNTEEERVELDEQMKSDGGEHPAEE